MLSELSAALSWTPCALPIRLIVCLGDELLYRTSLGTRTNRFVTHSKDDLYKKLRILFCNSHSSSTFFYFSRDPTRFCLTKSFAGVLNLCVSIGQLYSHLRLSWHDSVTVTRLFGSDPSIINHTSLSPLLHLSQHKRQKFVRDTKPRLCFQLSDFRLPRLLDAFKLVLIFVLLKWETRFSICGLA